MMHQSHSKPLVFPHYSSRKRNSTKKKKAWRSKTFIIKNHEKHKWSPKIIKVFTIQYGQNKAIKNN